MTRWLPDKTASDLEAMSARNRASHVKPSKIDLRPAMRRELVKDYGKAAGKAFDEAQVAKPSAEQPQGLSCKPVAPKKRKNTVYAPVPTEHAEQSAVIEWFDLYAPTVGLDPRLLFCVPNGSSKSIPQAMKFKREGLRPGVPDLMLPVAKYADVRSIRTFGLFIEMKRKHGSQLREDQAEMIALLQAQGYRCFVAKGADEAIAAILEYLG